MNAVAKQRGIRHDRTVVSLRTILYAAAIACAPTLAHAQSINIDPGAAPTITPAPTPPPSTPSTPSQAPSPSVIVIGPDGKPVEQPSNEPDTSGLYHYDGDTNPYTDDDHLINAGPVPELHVVARGDTLWDICWYYFNDPWQWPKIWSYNAQITNPHWIYPGDLVRLLPKGMGGTAVTPHVEDVENGDQTDQAYEPPPAKKYEVDLKQVAFVDQKNLDDTVTIDGAVDEKQLLSEGDAVYLAYPPDKPPKVGATYSIYEKGEDVTHPRSGDTIGSYVRILGELQVTSVKKDKRARGVITDANREIERGDLVGPLKKQLKTVPPAPNKVDAQGTIVAMLEGDQIMGQGEVVFLDLGKKSGLEVGNRMYVVRRGDAFTDTMAPASEIGQDDRRFPARRIGDVVIVDVGRDISIGLITGSVEEMGVGDQVMMQKTPQ